MTLSKELPLMVGLTDAKGETKWYVANLREARILYREIGVICTYILKSGKEVTFKPNTGVGRLKPKE